MATTTSATRPAASGPASAPSAEPPPDPAAAATVAAEAAAARAAFAEVSAALGRAGALREGGGSGGGGVYVVSVPRDDLTVLIEGMQVPTAAGLESTLWFYHCPCGKTNVVGQICAAGPEVNTVIDALRAGHVEVASVAPMVLNARQAPMLIRFQAEGQPKPIATAIREALRWAGDRPVATAPAATAPAGGAGGEGVTR